MKIIKKVLFTFFIVMLSFSAFGCGVGSEKNSDSRSEAAMTNFPKFNGKDVNGNPISSDIFKQNKLTLVNVWGTFCGPCLKELPYLQQLQNEMKDKGLNVIGIVSDGEESKEEAIKILKKNNINFINIMPNKEIKEKLLINLNAVPVTMLVDKEGNIVGEVLVGGRSKEQFETIVEKQLNRLK